MPYKPNSSHKKIITIYVNPRTGHMEYLIPHAPKYNDNIIKMIKKGPTELLVYCYTN